MESILERNKMKRTIKSLKSADCALSATPMIVSSASEASGQETE